MMERLPSKGAFVRAAASILVSVGLVAALAGCSTPSQPGASIDGCEPAASGAASAAVKVSGEFGTAPEVNFEAPTSVDATQRSVVIAGDGDVALEGTTVNVEFTIYNGETGEKASESGYADTPSPFNVDDAEFLVGIVKTLQCSTAGSRVVGVIPPDESWGEAGSPQLGIEPGQDIVFVADIVSVDPAPLPPLDRAQGEPQEPTAGLPTVELDDAGRPTVTIPGGAAPTELEIATLIKGDGAEVAIGDDVVVHYVGTSWDTREVFDESWARGAPATFNTQAVIQGFTEALVGQKVGSQVIAVIPPELAYGTDPAAHDLGGQTLVFVIDILGIA